MISKLLPDILIPSTESLKASLLSATFSVKAATSFCFWSSGRPVLFFASAKSFWFFLWVSLDDSSVLVWSPVSALASASIASIALVAFRCSASANCRSSLSLSAFSLILSYSPTTPLKLLAPLSLATPSAPRFDRSNKSLFAAYCSLACCSLHLASPSSSSSFDFSF